jgi:hypothetical protein
MKFKSIRNWQLTPALDGLLFFAQRLDELLWDFSLDTYKPSALNAPFLCKEALDLINDIEADLIDAQNLKPVLEELLWSVQNDPVAKTLLDLPIEHYVLTAEGVKPAEQKLRLEVLGRTLESFRYLHACFDHLCEKVVAVEKKEIDSTTRSMVTTLINMGLSKRILFQKTNDFFFSQNGPHIASTDCLKDFLQTIYPLLHDFKVYFLVSNLITSVEESVNQFGIELLNELPNEVSNSNAATGFIRGTDEVYVRVSRIRCSDVFTAYEKAASKLDNLSDLFTLFYHQRKIAWQTRAVVEQCCLDEPVLVNSANGPMEKAFDLPQEKASKELNRLMRNFAARGTSFDKFNRVADLHGICVSSDIVDNQLVNLWTALETLVPTHTGSSKIVKISDAMVSFLMTSYVKRLVQRFHHDLVVWNGWKTKGILSQVNGFKKPETLLRTLALLSLEEYVPLRNDLYAKLKDFHLLRFRAFQLSEMLTSPDKVQHALETHEMKVRWQIRRIYRTRNLIVHSGRKPTYIHSLIENGHDYLDQILFDVMKLSCGEYRAKTLEQAFELAKVKHQNFSNQLAGVGKFDKNNCLFLCSDFDTLMDFVNQRWGSEPDESPPPSTSAVVSLRAAPVEAETVNSVAS